MSLAMSASVGRFHRKETAPDGAPTPDRGPDHKENGPPYGWYSPYVSVPPVGRQPS